MDKVNVRKLASMVGARLNCIEAGNKEWEDKHEETIEEMVRLLPHGSGLDGDTVLDYQKSTGSKLVIRSEYHTMDEMGGYGKWINFRLEITGSLMFGYDMNITGDFRSHEDVKAYLHELYSEWITTEEG